MHAQEFAYRKLADAIVIQAADDYRKALDGKGYDDTPPEQVIEETEKFFHSSWYRMLTTVNGKYLISRLRKEHKEKQRKEQLCESN